MEISEKAPPAGYLSVVLHAHLPYIRYPEHKTHLEERWLFEAITGTYLPLIDLFGGLIDDQVDFRVTVSLTPTLLEMLADPLLIGRYQLYLGGLIEMADREVFRTKADPKFGPVAAMYRQRFRRLRDLFERTCLKDLPAAFHRLAESGKVELIASSATHAYLPALMQEPAAARAQVLLGLDCFRKRLGRDPKGFWLPECGFTPELEPILKEAGIGFFFLESHGVLGSVPGPRHSIYAAVRTPSGAAAFSRDAESSRQVWSSASGYPGDPDYRDFYRDIGFDLDTEYLRPCLPDGIRTFTGIKYYRVTGKTDNKKPYLRRRALMKARTHAEHFLRSKDERILLLRDRLKIRPVVTVAYDAELFGHWWFEGPEWLGHVMRRTSVHGRSFRFVTPSEYLAESPELQTVTPSMSSWGEQGYSRTWVDDSNGWIYRHILRASRRMRGLSLKHPQAKGLAKRTLCQAGRELLLMQASDWAFMMKKGNAAQFAQGKFGEHLHNFSSLCDMLESGIIDRKRLSSLEGKNRLFPGLDYRYFGGRPFSSTACQTGTTSDR